MTKTEATFLVNKGIDIVLYYSPTNTTLTSTTTADSEAAQAESEASAIGAKSGMGIAIYRDVEPPGYGYTINSSYVTRWYQDLSGAGYYAGFYEDSYTGPFESAFCSASANAIADTYLQTAVYQSGSSYLESNAPATYAPYSVNCESSSQMLGWQYLEGDPSPHVDVDEFSATGAMY